MSIGVKNLKRIYADGTTGSTRNEIKYFIIAYCYTSRKQFVSGEYNFIASTQHKNFKIMRMFKKSILRRDWH